MRTVVVYPGRFQPFGKHHFATYKWLTERFGADNVYISTSNVVDSRSPLTFEEKFAVMRKFGVPKDKIVESEKPYMPSTLLSSFDSSKDSLIVAYGQKDYGRIRFTKKDGSPAYFKNYTGQKELSPFKNNAFVVVAPHVSINHRGYEVCGTYLRELLSSCTRKEMFEVMGWADEGLYGIFRRKFSLAEHEKPAKGDKVIEPLYEVDTFKEVLEANISNQGTYTKHIQHPFEADMVFGEFKKLVYDLGKNTQAIKNCTLKLDGWNLQMTYRGGSFCCSRNKSTVINPMSFEQLSKKYEKNPKAQEVFCRAFKAIETALSGNKPDDLDRAFNKGSTFLNFEILDDEPLNVLKTGYKALSVHGTVTYTKEGNESYRTNVLPNIVDVTLGRTYNGLTILETPKINLNVRKNANQFIDKLTLLQHKYKIPESANIVSLSPEVVAELRIFTFDLGNVVIKENYNKVDLFGNINRIVSIIDSVADCIASPTDFKSFEEACYTLDRLGGLPAINPVEGFVFEWNGRCLKLTGTFGALVPIFRIWNKQRFS